MVLIEHWAYSELEIMIGSLDTVDFRLEQVILMKIIAKVVIFLRFQEDQKKKYFPNFIKIAKIITDNLKSYKKQLLQQFQKDI